MNYKILSTIVILLAFIILLMLGLVTKIDNEVLTLHSPYRYSLNSSPLEISGEIVGNWTFEATFVLQLLDSNKDIIISKPIMVQGDWMTTNKVPFETIINFPEVNAQKGYLRFIKDNPSDIPEFDDHLDIPIFIW